MKEPSLHLQVENLAIFLRLTHSLKGLIVIHSCDEPIGRIQGGCFRNRARGKNDIEIVLELRKNTSVKSVVKQNNNNKRYLPN